MMLTLYQVEWCPYCHRVRQVMTELGLTYITVNVQADRDKRADVMAISDQAGVPVLQDGDKVFSDSDEILEYLRSTYPAPEDAEEHAALGAWRAAGALSIPPRAALARLRQILEEKGFKIVAQIKGPKISELLPKEYVLLEVADLRPLDLGDDLEAFLLEQLAETRQRGPWRDGERAGGAPGAEGGVFLGVFGRRVGAAQVLEDLVRVAEDLVAVLQHGDAGLVGDGHHVGALVTVGLDVDRDVREAELGHHLAYPVAVGAPFNLIEREHHPSVAGPFRWSFHILAESHSRERPAELVGVGDGRQAGGSTAHVGCRGRGPREAQRGHPLRVGRVVRVEELHRAERPRRGQRGAVQAPRRGIAAAPYDDDVVWPFQVAKQRLSVGRRRDAVLFVVRRPRDEDLARLVAPGALAGVRLEAQEHLGHERVLLEYRERARQKPGAGAGLGEAVVQAAVGGAQALAGWAGERLRVLQPLPLGGDLVGVQQGRRHRRLVDEQRSSGTRLTGRREVVRHRGVATAVLPEEAEQLDGALRELGALEHGRRAQQRPRGQRVPVHVHGGVHEGLRQLGAFCSVEAVVVLVRILAAAEGRQLGAPQRGEEVVDRALGRGAIERAEAEASVGGPVPAGRVPAGQHRGLEVQAGQASVVLQHLLVVRNGPVALRRVAKEPSGHVVVEAATGHALQRRAHDVGEHGRWRPLRPRGRRVLSLRDAARLDRSALREDAGGQRSPGRPVPRGRGPAPRPRGTG